MQFEIQRVLVFLRVFKAKLVHRNFATEAWKITAYVKGTKKWVYMFIFLWVYIVYMRKAGPVEKQFKVVSPRKPDLASLANIDRQWRSQVDNSLLLCLYFGVY